MGSSEATDIRAAKASFAEVVLVCGKCARKLGEKGVLRKAMKRALKSGRWGRRVRVVETSCLDLCPKRRQVVATGGGLAERRLLVLSPGASPEAALDALLEAAIPVIPVAETAVG